MHIYSNNMTVLVSDICYTIEKEKGYTSEIELAHYISFLVLSGILIISKDTTEGSDPDTVIPLPLKVAINTLICNNIIDKLSCKPPKYKLVNFESYSQRYYIDKMKSYEKIIPSDYERSKLHLNLLQELIYMTSDTELAKLASIDSMSEKADIDRAIKNIYAKRKDVLKETSL